jgi:hypothetical protein
LSRTPTCTNRAFITYIKAPPEPTTSNEKQPNLSSVEAYETRDDDAVAPLFETYGTYGLGIDLTSVAWPKMRQSFTEGDVKQREAFTTPPSGEDIDIDRIPRSYLRQHPVDLLVLGNLNRDAHEAWMQRIPGLRFKQTPDMILEFWEPWYITRNSDGPMSKLVVTRWNTLGY